MKGFPKLILRISENSSTLKHDFSSLRVFSRNLDPQLDKVTIEVSCDKISESSLVPLVS